MPKLRTQKSGQQADECHVGRIIIVEELAKPLAAASLSVVQRQQRHSQPAGHVNHAIRMAVEDEEGYGIKRDDEHHPEHLLVEIITVPSDGKYSQWGSTAPV